MIFKYALKNKLITENPTIDAIIPSKEVTVEELENKDQLKEFVFRNSEGYPYTVPSIRSRMYSLLKKTKIKKHATPHIFRHTYVSMLAEAGVDLHTTMSRVGHEDEKTTLTVYTHVTKKMQLNADLKIKKHYADVLNLSVLQES